MSLDDLIEADILAQLTEHQDLTVNEASEWWAVNGEKALNRVYQTLTDIVMEVPTNG